MLKLLSALYYGAFNRKVNILRPFIITEIIVFQATIFEPIIDFEVVLKYIPTVFDSNTHAGFSAGGYYKNKLPLGNEVTFFFEYKKGKI